MYKRHPAVVEPNTTQEILELLKAQNVKPASFGMFNEKNINALVIAAIIGIVAFIWTSVTQQPQKIADQSSQITEIRTTVLGLRNDFAEFKQSLAIVQKDGADTRSRTDTNAAEIEALKKGVQANSDRINQLEKDTR